MYSQIVGKLRLALSPPEPEWGHVALYVTSRGLTTGPIPYRDRTFQVDFDFIEHRVKLETNDGQIQTIELVSGAVCDFYDAMMHSLAALGIEVKMWPVPCEIPNPVRFTADTAYAPYEREPVHRFWKALSAIDSVFKEHRAPFRGRHTPVHFFWGSFDLAYSRYSGLPADPPPNSGIIMRKAMDAQEVSAGFWAGDERYADPAFYYYAYPKPDAIERARISPSPAGWNTDLGEFILPYAEVRNATSPRAALLEFLGSSYEVCTQLAGWKT